MFEFIRSIQLDAMLFLSGVCAVLLPMTWMTKTLSHRRKTYLFLLEGAAMLLMIFDRFAYMYRGDPSNLGFWMVRISNFIVFALELSLLHYFNLYLWDLLRNEGGLKKRPREILAVEVLYTISLILLIVSQFTGLYYTFDETNTYHRAPMIFLNYAFSLIMMILHFSLVLRYRFGLGRRMVFPLLLFSILPFAATIAQFFLYGISLANFTSVFFVILLYIFGLRDLGLAVEESRAREIKTYREEEKRILRLFSQTTEALAAAIDAKDRYTHGHSARVADYSLRLARAAGKSEEECQKVYYAALLHDVGKIGVPDGIITKDGKLTDNEFARIREHPVHGNRILSRISESPYLSIGAHYHHERYDGHGYPDGLKGDDIPEIARIIAVADAYDAMTSKRSYRDPLPQQKVREELYKGIGTQFDPEYARRMILFLDLDTDYTMQEGEQATNQAVTTRLNCGELYSEYSEGTELNDHTIRMSLYSKPDADSPAGESLPSLVLFDSLDSRIHLDDSKIRELMYFEFARIRMDGEITSAEGHTRRIVSKQERIPDAPVEPDAAVRELGTRYDIQAVRQKDHVQIRIASAYQTLEITLALPDSTRFSYLALTGSYCAVTNIRIERDEQPVPEGHITRIAPEISYIDGEPEGDLPNLQIDGWRSAATRGIPLSGKTVVTFSARSLPIARLVWHCPYIVIFSGSDAKVSGNGYQEYSLIRLDGESWYSDIHADNDITAEQTGAFRGWNDWKERYKQGLNITVTLTRDGNTVTMETENAGLALHTRTVIKDSVETIYAAITGDQCTVTNIHVSGA